MLQPHALGETIFAPATVIGTDPFTILRIVGPRAIDALEALTVFVPAGPPDYSKCWAGKAQLAVTPIASPFSVDVCVWNVARSPLGQPLVEITLPTCTPLLHAVMAELEGQGLRLAGRGEFSLRRFLTGKLDLAQAEGILQLIEANSPQEIARSLDRTTGNLSRSISTVRDRLLDALADLEAGLDFVEEDIEFIRDDVLLRDLADAVNELDRLTQRLNHQRIGRSAWRVVLEGPPNAGKSTLFNALLKAERSLVSSVAGTTRDVVAGLRRIGDWEFEFVDTAGRGETNDPLSASADEQRELLRATADIRVICQPACDEPCKTTSDQSDGDFCLVVRTKADLVPGWQGGRDELVLSMFEPDVDQRLREIERRIAAAAESMERSQARAASQRADDRSLAALEGAQRSLEQAMDCVRNRHGNEIVALCLREAIDRLGAIAGITYTDDLLDRIFGRFCIGK